MPRPSPAPWIIRITIAANTFHRCHSLCLVQKPAPIGAHSFSLSLHKGVTVSLWHSCTPGEETGSGHTAAKSHVLNLGLLVSKPSFGDHGLRGRDVPSTSVPSLLLALALQTHTLGSSLCTCSRGAYVLKRPHAPQDNFSLCVGFFPRYSFPGDKV